MLPSIRAVLHPGLARQRLGAEQQACLAHLVRAEDVAILAPFQETDHLIVRGPDEVDVPAEVDRPPNP